jgi:CBS domain containing-hemolysin-like protein
VTVAALILGTCILCEAFFSGAEIALITADKVKLRHRAENATRRQRAILSFLEDPGELISTSLVGTSICVVLSTVIATLTFVQRFPGQAELLSLAVMTPLILIFGEIVPKSIFQNYADRLAPAAIRALWVFRTLFYPVIALGSWLSNLLLRMLGLEESRALMTREELSLLLRLPGRDGADRITADERRMVSRIFDFKETTVDDVMLPLSEVTAMPVTATLDEVAEEIADKQHTRLPLYRERLDQIVGIVHAFDVLRAKGNEQVCDLCRPAIFVPESQPAVDTLVRLQREGQQLAVVVDEYGGATGIVTVEDILEEIVGEIADEHDEAFTDGIRMTSPDACEALAHVRIAVVNDRLDLHLPEEEDFETIGGFVFHRFGRIPEVGERIESHGASLEVLAATRRRIDLVRVERLGRAADGR